ncbi:uncharacterized protein PHALS_05685 [Plasmopara halstedii]|uniref:Uncharacterized protein n=1 Tax=Plasmopara halstedii TaxID=4781 RepID=A0A0P1B1X6_PLAHL|nr:uncharacterized protein PHALS_05685 [Plasmopara halstedii]CEG48215.1 hypothetical protein PHALS_05685 [Plasmopara halstedii]|eukprot:XP_024584584.1 hypothetical protein PHALS_05685 [Plasmopara halstedii]
MSWLLSLLERLIPLKWRMAYWLERRRSFDYVKTKLGMQNVPLSELSKHKHYPLFSKYQDDILMIRLTARLNRGDSTYSVWKNLKLDTISPQHDMTINELRHELEKIENTKVFQVYKRYAVMFDKTMSKSLDPTFDEDAVTLEKMARAHIWAENHWQKNDVKSFLGLSYASEDELKRNELYQFFLDKVKERRSAPQQWDL